MGGFSLRKRGDLSKTKKFLAKASNADYLRMLEASAARGVAALASNTPKDKGNTAGSWSYEIEFGKGHAKIIWTNSNLTYQGTPIAIMLQYGHGTGTGGYVKGRDYINPAMAPIFDEIAEEVIKVVRSL